MRIAALEHVAEFNNPGPALAIGDDELRARVRSLMAAPAIKRAAERLVESYARAGANSHNDRDGI